MSSFRLHSSGGVGPLDVSWTAAAAAASATLIMWSLVHPRKDRLSADSSAFTQWKDSIYRSIRYGLFLSRYSDLYDLFPSVQLTFGTSNRRIIIHLHWLVAVAQCSSGIHTWRCHSLPEKEHRRDISSELDKQWNSSPMHANCTNIHLQRQT